MTENKIYFIRPDDNDKRFTGQIIDGNQFYGFRDYIINYGTKPNSLILLCEPIYNYFDEYRLVIYKNKFLTGSLYHTNNEHIKKRMTYKNSKNIIKQGEYFANIYSPCDFYIMDLAVFNNEIKLLEIGSINMAGLYDCDIELIINKLIEI